MFSNPRLNISRNEQEYDKEILDIARVARIVAGGRRFSFRATVAIGNKQGLIGVGVDKGKDVSQAIDKAYRDAQKNMITIIRDEGTVPVDAIGHFKSARVLLKPARKGSGLIAGGVVRALCMLAGIENISSKILSKTNNKLNIARATLNAFEIIRRYSLQSSFHKSEEDLKKETGKTPIIEKPNIEKPKDVKQVDQTQKAAGVK